MTSKIVFSFVCYFEKQTVDRLEILIIFNKRGIRITFKRNPFRLTIFRSIAHVCYTIILEADWRSRSKMAHILRARLSLTAEHIVNVYVLILSENRLEYISIVLFIFEKRGVESTLWMFFLFII